MKTLVICVLLVCSMNATAFPLSDTHKTKPLTKKQLRVAVTLMAIDRFKSMHVMQPIQLQLGNASRLMIFRMLTRTLP